MAGENLNRILDGLDLEMLESFNAYAQTLRDTWEGFSGNEGQSSIIENHIWPAVQEHISQAKDGWPRSAGPDDYYGAVSGCYDPEVIERAFGDTINGSYEEISEFQAESEDLQLEHDHVASIMSNGGPPPDPHSTEWFGKFDA